MSNTILLTTITSTRILSKIQMLLFHIAHLSLKILYPNDDTCIL